jgi:mycinamicin biosynthesis methyltransferase MycE-like protein
MEGPVPGTESWNGIDQLVGAVGGRDAELLQAIDRIGPGQVAGMLAVEIQERAEAPGGAGNTVLNLRIDHDDTAYRYAVLLKDGQALVVPGEADDACAEVSYSLLDLTRLLYPHRPGYQSTSREVRLRWSWDQPGSHGKRQMDEMVQRAKVDSEQMFADGQAWLARIFRSVQCLISACSEGNASLNDLAARYGSDKWGGLHWYTPHYMNHFSPLRYDPVKVLEIGIGGYKYASCGGESLYMWQHFFPRGLIYGVDIYPKPGVRGPRIRTIQGSQNDPAFLRSLAAEFGPFDIIIDDGSHINEHVRTSFEELFGSVRPGGYYVIEDLHTSFWPEFGGEAPPCSSRTTIGLIKDLIEGLHISEYAGQDAGGTQLTHPSEVSVYHNIAFLRKGIGSEHGIPDWIKQLGVQVGSMGPGSEQCGG